MYFFCKFSTFFKDFGLAQLHSKNHNSNEIQTGCGTVLIWFFGGRKSCMELNAQMVNMFFPWDFVINNEPNLKYCSLQFVPTWSKIFPPILIWRSFMSVCKFLSENSINLVFLTFRVHLFAFNHSKALSSSIFASSKRVAMFVFGKVVSSANKSGRSFIKSKNKNGPIKQPRGTQHKIFSFSESAPFMDTNCSLFDK